MPLTDFATCWAVERRTHANLRRAGDRHEHHLVLRVDAFDKRRQRFTNDANRLPDGLGDSTTSTTRRSRVPVWASTGNGSRHATRQERGQRAHHRVELPEKRCGIIRLPGIPRIAPVDRVRSGDYNRWSSPQIGRRCVMLPDAVSSVLRRKAAIARSCQSVPTHPYTKPSR